MSTTILVLLAQAPKSDVQAALLIFGAVVTSAVVFKLLRYGQSDSQGEFLKALSQIAENLDLDMFLFNAIDRFASTRYPNDKMSIFRDPRAFDDFVSFVLSEENDEETLANLRLELTRIRTLMTRAKTRGPLHSSQDILIGTILELRAVHPDFEEVYEVDPVFVEVSWLNVGQIGGRIANSDDVMPFKKGQKIWVRFHQDKQSYVFQTRIDSIKGESFVCQHSGFLILEKRVAPRFKLALKAEVRWQNSVIEAQTDNLSDGGAALVCQSLIPLNEEIEVEIGFDQPLRLKASLRNVSAVDEQSVRLHCQFIENPETVVSNFRQQLRAKILA